MRTHFKSIISFVLGILVIPAFADDFNVKSFGAVSDTTQLSTSAINQAVQVCHSKGGGRVVIPAGQYKSGTITLKTNVELHLERGAVLYASTRHEDFPQQAQPEYRSQKDPGGWFALIYAEGQQNIALTGSGTIDGRGALQIPRPQLPGGDLDGRPRNVLFISCRDVTVQDISMRNAGIWNQHYLNCEDVIVDRIRVYNHANRNNDGIDIDGCRRFVLSNSIIDSDDDAIVLKSTGKEGCSDVVITNCIASSFTNAIKCGTESTGGFRNITISNCVVKRSKSTTPPIFGRTNIGITAISLEIVDGGIMDGVNVDNIVVEATECPIYIRLANRARKYMEGIPTPASGIMRNVSISNVIAHSAGNYTSSITGVPAAKIQNVRLSNITLINQGGVKAGEFISSAAGVDEDEKGYPEPTIWKNLPASGLFIRHVEDLSMSDVTLGSLSVDPRTPVIGVDIDRLYIRGLKNRNSSEPVKTELQDVRFKEIE